MNILRPFNPKACTLLFKNHKSALRALANAFLEEWTDTNVGEIQEVSSLISSPWFLQLGCLQNPIQGSATHGRREQRVLVDLLFLHDGTERSIIIPSDSTQHSVRSGETKDTDVFCLLLCPEFKMEDQLSAQSVVSSVPAQDQIYHDRP